MRATLFSIALVTIVSGCAAPRIGDRLDQLLHRPARDESIAETLSAEAHRQASLPDRKMAHGSVPARLTSSGCSSGGG
jgi:hypothetical protein